MANLVSTSRKVRTQNAILRASNIVPGAMKLMAAVVYLLIATCPMPRVAIAQSPDEAAFAQSTGANPTEAQSARTVSGQVKGRAGAPLEGVSISLIQHAGKDPSGGNISEIRGQSISGYDGRFSIGGLASGTYVLTAMYPGERPLVRENIVVSDTNETVVELQF